MCIELAGASLNQQGHAGTGEACEQGNEKLTTSKSGWISENMCYSCKVRWDTRQKSMELLSQTTSSLATLIAILPYPKNMYSIYCPAISVSFWIHAKE